MRKLISLSWCIIISVFVVSVGYAQSPKPKIRGVVMGISKYMNVPSLQYADRDALSFYEYLLSPAGGKADTNNIRLLLNEKATSYNFFEAMDNLLDAAKEGDIVYIYFAGHGDIEKKTERQNGFLIGYNAPPNCYAAGGSISVRFLQDYVETLVSKNKSKVILIVDACRSGKLAGGNEGAEITALALKAEWKGVTKILSCQPGEKSLEGDNWGGGAGVFTYFLLKGMKGLADNDKNNNVSLVELSHYLDNEVPKETDNKQMPEVVGDKRQDIAKVDKETYLAMLNKSERKTIIPENLSAGFEVNLNSIDDVSIIKAYERFKEYIKTENLISYTDADANKETALSIYRSLEGTREANPILTSMKRELLAALQNKAQYMMNKWLDSEFIDSTMWYPSYMELKTAFELIDSTYISYNQIKSRYYLWKSHFVKETEEKINLIKECLKLEPNEGYLFFSLGNLYKKLNNLSEAIRNYNKAIELLPNLVWAYNNLGTIHSMIGQYDDALGGYNKAIELKLDFAPAWYNKGLSLLSLGKIEEALKCFNKVIELKPDDYTAWSSKGVSLAFLKKYEEAINCYDKAIELKSDYYIAWNNKGVSLADLGKYGEAINCYDKAIEIKPEYADAWNNKGTELEFLRKYEEAINCFDKAIEINPENAGAWNNKGNAYSALKKHEEAIKCYDKVLDLKPDNLKAWYNKACSYALLKNKEEMLKSLKRAIELNPQFKQDAKKDKDFKDYYEDADFKKLVE